MAADASRLVEAALERFRDASEDVEKIVRCLTRHSGNPEEAKSCILRELTEET